MKSLIISRIRLGLSPTVAKLIISRTQVLFALIIFLNITVSFAGETPPLFTVNSLQTDGCVRRLQLCFSILADKYDYATVQFPQGPTETIYNGGTACHYITDINSEISSTLQFNVVVTLHFPPPPTGGSWGSPNTINVNLASVFAANPSLKGVYIGDPYNSNNFVNLATYYNAIGTSLFNGHNDVNSQKLEIYSSSGLLVTRPFEFTKTNLYMAPGTGINVGYIVPNPPITYTAPLAFTDHSLVTAACEYMWRGIEVYSNSRLAIDHSTVQWAMYAVRPIENCTHGGGHGGTQPPCEPPHISLNYSTFQQNFISFRATNGVFTIDSYNGAGGFQGNRFLGLDNGGYGMVHQGSLVIDLPNNINPFPFPDGKKGVYALYITGSANNFSEPNLSNPSNTDYNFIRNLGNGIYAENINLTVKYFQFQDIERGQGGIDLYGDRGGVGIRYVEGQGNHNFTQSGFGNNLNSPLSFNHCEWAIISSLYVNVLNPPHINISNNNMDFMQSGISTLGLPGNVIENVSDNRITLSSYFGYPANTSMYAIGVTNNTSNTGVYSFSFNNIRVAYNYSGTAIQPMGIYALGFSQPHNNYGLRIEFNAFDIIQGRYGIYSQDYSRINIARNTNFHLHNNATGIFCMNQNFGNIYCNSIEYDANQSISNNTIGMQFNKCPSTDIRGNTTKSLLNGIKFLDECGNSKVATNKFDGTESIGLYYGNNNTFTGPEPVQSTNPNDPKKTNKNIWTSTFSGTAAKNDGNPVASFYYVRNNTTEYPSPINPSMNWFFNNATMDNSAIECPPDISFTDPDTQLMDTFIVNGGYGSSIAYAAVMNWELSRDLYKKLDQFPALKTGIFNTFYNSNQTGPIGFLDGIDKRSSQMFIPNNSKLNTLDSLNTNYCGALNQYLVNDSLLKVPCSNIDSITILAQQDYLLTKTSIFGVQIDSVINLINADRSALATQAITDNAAISSTSTYDQNEKIILDYYLRTLPKGITKGDSTQQANLLAIAKQCPLDGGSVVIHARSLYALWTGKILPLVLCSDLVYRNANEETHISAQLYPNPANDELNIILTNQKSVIGDKIIIMNYAGQTVRQFDLKEKTDQLTVSTDAFANGLYILSVMEDGKIIDSQKFIIQH